MHKWATVRCANVRENVFWILTLSSKSAMFSFAFVARDIIYIVFSYLLDVKEKISDISLSLILIRWR